MSLEAFEKNLLARHLGEGEGRSLEAESAKLGKLAPAIRAVVLERLNAIDELSRLERATLDDADRVAARLGMRRGNLYRLMARVKEHGPVTGLTPHARSKPRASAASQGLHPIAERAVLDVLSERPDARLAEVRAAIKRAYGGASSDVRPPSEATVRRRLAVLRQPGGFRDREAWKAGRTFGRKVLVDQCAVVSKAHGVDANLVLVFIADVETRLVIGCGQSLLDDQSVGLRQAIRQARAGAEAMVVGGFGVAPAPESIRWVVPDDMLATSDQWGPMVGSGGTVARLTSGTRRHGQRLVQLLGPEFDTFRLMPRVIGEGLRRSSELQHTPPPDLQSEVSAAVARWNYRVLEAASGLEPTLEREEQQSRLNAWRGLQSGNEVAGAIEQIIARLEDALDFGREPSPRTA